MRLGLRIGLGLALAIGSLVALHLVLRTADAEAAARSAPSPVHVAARQARLPPVRLVPAGGRVLLASRPDAVPADAAPIVQVLGDGSHVILRPAPLSATPDVAAPASAIVLPGTDLRAIDPRARATFAEVVGRLVAERPVPSARFVTLDFPLALTELEAVLRWVP